MKVLVATRLTQGHADDDYCWTVEGELVLGGALLECDCVHCGCTRGFPGLASTRATTTAAILEWPCMTRAKLVAAIRDSLDRQGVLAVMSEDEIEVGLNDEIELLDTITSAFQVGAIVHRQGTQITQRAHIEWTASHR